MKTKMIGFIRRAGLVFTLAFFALHLLAQTKVISGKVTSSTTHEPLPGVTVAIKNTNKATTTNQSGEFSLTSGEANPVLVLTFVGYTSAEIPVSGADLKSLELTPAARAMDEVVVIGYGSVKRSDVTGAVVSLKASELTPGANVNVQQMLQGRASGVQISQKSGEPGGAMNVQIRGITSITAGNDPLYVIDGMPVNNEAPVSGTGAFFSSATPRNPLNSLNPSDIASIEILKDASATAIYGSRGA